jgi:hypothetical protein
MPGGNKNIAPQDNPKPFEKGTSGNPNGRPVKVFSQLAKEFQARGLERATPEVVKELYEYLLSLPFAEIEAIAKGYATEDDDTPNPAIMKIAAGEMVSNRKLEIMREMLDRAHGKSKQAIDHTSGGDKIGQDDWFKSLPLEAQIEILRIKNEHGEQPANDV